MDTASLQQHLFLLLYFMVLKIPSATGVSRRVEMNSALHLECRMNQFIKINKVILGRQQPSCSYILSAKHNDYRRVITECSGLQSCSNIVLKHSTEIPCADTGLHTSHYMDVDYTCVADYAMVSMCHDTVGAVALFEGYIASPGYPSQPTLSASKGAGNTSSVPEVVCSCQISSLSPSARLQLLLIEMPSSKWVRLADGNSTRYLCHNRTQESCMNDLYVTYYPTVNITYKPLHIYNSKFLLQYSTVGQRSRVRVVCSMTWNIPVSSPTLKSHPTSPGNTDEVPVETFSLEAKVGVFTAAVFLVICILFAVICRCWIRHKEGTFPPFETYVRNKTAMCSDEYDTIRVNSSQYSHVYDETFSTHLPSDKYTRQLYSVRGSEASGIYESIEHLDRQSRFSEMKKSGSMPNKPPPPIPRNASNKLPVASAVAVDTGFSHNCSSLSASLDSMPAIDMDFSDLLRETKEKFTTQMCKETPGVTYDVPVNEVEYMIPAQLVNSQYTSS